MASWADTVQRDGAIENGPPASLRRAAATQRLVCHSTAARQNFYVPPRHRFAPITTCRPRSLPGLPNLEPTVQLSHECCGADQ